MMTFRSNKFYFVTVFIAAILAISAFISNVQAQQSKIFESGIISGVSYASTDFENINMTNGALNLNFPLAGLQGRGQAGHVYTLRYNSKLWSTVTNEIYNPHWEPNWTTQEFLADSAEGGWHDSDKYQVSTRDRFERGDYPNGDPCTANVVWQLAYRKKVEVGFPDSSKVEFRPAGYSDVPPGGTADDGGYFNVDTQGRVTTVTWQGGGICNHTTSTATGARMTYYSSDGSGMRLTFANAESLGYIWELSMPDGSKVLNLAGGVQRIVDRNGNYVESATVTLPDGTQTSGWVDQFGRYIARTKAETPNIA